MTTDPLIIRKYVYIHDNKGPSQEIVSHQILPRKRGTLGCFFFTWNILLGIIFVKRLYGQSIKKESIVIMPGFGVQLEMHHQSRRVIRHFVPIGKILKPVLNECVTPVTYYWSLALILGDEEELMLVFQPQELVKMNKDELLKKFENGLVPDHEIRQLIRGQLERRLQWGYKPTYEEQIAQLFDLAQSLRKLKIADEVETLDSQLYEVPIAFLRIMNGAMLKGSGCYFKDDSTTLDEAEIAMLDLYCERAQIEDGQSVLDLGCGQGAFTLHVAQKFKKCRVTAITNSVAQKEFIEDQAKKSNLSNVKVMLADITKHETNDTFDRIVVIELFEHMKNYELLLRKISKWMSKDGFLFIEHICHKTFAYHYEPMDEEDWFTTFVFPAGTMLIPSASFFLYFQDDVSVVKHWTLSGKHFSRSNETWLKRIDANLDTVKAIFESFLGNKEAATKYLNYWRGFCLSGMEMFGCNNGEEWMTTHLLLKKK